MAAGLTPEQLRMLVRKTLQALEATKASKS